MQLDRPLDDLLRSRSHVRVLRALHELPDGLPATAREVARRSGVSHPTASTVLDSLVDQGVVRVRRAARANAFELNRRHVLAEKMTPLFGWERQLRTEFLEFLQKEITRQAKSANRAFVFGSAIRGEMTPASDIDVAVASAPGRVEETEVAMARVAESVRERFGNRLSVIITARPLEQLSRPGSRGYRLWDRILKEGVPLSGR